MEDAPTISANNVKVCNAWQEQSYTLSSNDTTKNINNTLQTPTESTSAVMTKKGKAEYSSKVLRNSNTNLTSINANIGGAYFYVKKLRLKNELLYFYFICLELFIYLLLE